MKKDLIMHTLRSCSGGQESTELRTVTYVRTGETDVIVEHAIRERFSVKEIAKAVDLYERLTCGSGRQTHKPSDLAHPYNPDPSFEYLLPEIPRAHKAGEK